MGCWGLLGVAGMIPQVPMSCYWQPTGKTWDFSTTKNCPLGHPRWKHQAHNEGSKKHKKCLVTSVEHIIFDADTQSYPLCEFTNRCCHRSGQFLSESFFCQAQLDLYWYVVALGVIIFQKKLNPVALWGTTELGTGFLISPKNGVETDPQTQTLKNSPSYISLTNF